MKIRIRTCTEETLTVSAANAKEIIPYQSIMASPHIKKPYCGLLYYRGDVIPVTGPLPSVWEKSTSYDAVPWIIVFKDHARVILGLPQVLDGKTDESLGEESLGSMGSADSMDSVDEDSIAAALEDAISSIA